MLKQHEVNPLSVFGLRRMEHCPPHFTKFTFNLYASEKVIADWIWENLTGRFYIGEEYSGGPKGTPREMQKMVAFEIPGEASYFSLILDTINANVFEI